MEQYKRWMDEYGAQSLGKLQAVARQQGVKFNMKLAEEALRPNVGRQIYAPPPRSTGHSAATRPNTVFQADLMDMSKYRDHPEDGKYALELVDVYSRKAFTQSIPDKSAATVSRAFDTLKAEARAQPNAVVTTDMGGEFANLKGIVHRTKDPASTNGIAVADRTMQTLKKLAVSRMASTDDNWNQALDKATDQYNKRPNPAVFGAPGDVAKHKIAQFFIADENAKHFIHNEKDTDRKANALKREKAFREAVSSGGRSFKPQYSSEVLPVTGLSQGRQYVESNGKQVLLKLAKPVPSTSEAPRRVLQSAPREEPERRRAPQPNPDNPMPQIPIKQGVPLMEGRPRTAASSSAPSGAASSSGASSSVPAFANPRSAYLAARFGGQEPKRTPEQHAQIKAEAQRKRDEKAAADRQKAAAKLQKERQKEREAEERKSMAKAEKEARAAAKAQPKRR